MTENGEKLKKHFETGHYHKGVHQSRRMIRSLKQRADTRRKFSARVADFMTSIFGSITFLALNVVWFTAWILVNLNQIPAIAPFDPSFGLLTMIVSLEAIVLAIFVLISQNRAAKVDDLREEIDLQVDIITEEEMTKLMEMVAKLMEKNGIDVSHDETLKAMLLPTNIEKIEKALERQVGE
ncbi:MAG: DUF1003 domain-containing protein [Patescibacteria group bacterium]